MPARCSNHWPTQTQMVSEGYIYVLVRIGGRHVLPVCKSPHVVYYFSANHVTFTHHLSLCSSMVRASHWQSEGYGFDSCQGLWKFFWESSLRVCILKHYNYQATTITLMLFGSWNVNYITWIGSSMEQL